MSVWHVKRLVFPKVKATHDAIHIDLQRKGPQMHHTDTVRELSSSNSEKKKWKFNIVANALKGQTSRYHSINLVLGDLIHGFQVQYSLTLSRQLNYIIQYNVKTNDLSTMVSCI